MGRGKELGASGTRDLSPEGFLLTLPNWSIDMRIHTKEGNSIAT